MGQSKEYLADLMKSASPACRALNGMADAKPASVEIVKPKSDLDKLNKTERMFLEFMKRCPYTWIGAQNVTLKLAHDCRLTVDFVGLRPDGKMDFIDVKGFQREDALIKIKVAARLFPFWNFLIVKRLNNEWQWHHVTP